VTTSDLEAANDAVPQSAKVEQHVHVGKLIVGYGTGCLCNDYGQCLHTSSLSLAQY